MRMGISVPTFGEFADVRVLADLAGTAESAGWDGFFVWDHVVWPWADEIVDAWIALAAVALRTERIRFGPLVAPLPRRRPAKVARETVTLDRLSGGRLILGAGAGDFPAEFTDLGEAGDAVTRAAMLDEALTVVDALWSGEAVHFNGAHYQVRGAQFRPRALQLPRIPVWIGGQWPRPGSLARAVRWDGYVPIKADQSATTPADVAAMADRLDLASRPGFDLVVFGSDEDVAGYASAGATWWIDSPLPWEPSLTEMQRRAAAGPPGRSA
jgi:alkanesulfonate monooxygenase SsuD/methylene tetrahydromethanopterin reductase-like flavin-dependent oxidoreductase (luciferase family)